MTLCLDQKEVKQLVRKCLEELKISSSPAASRFVSKLNGLLHNHERCEVDKIASLKNIDKSSKLLFENKFELNEMKQKNKILKDLIYESKNGVDRENVTIQERIDSIKCRNRQVKEIVAHNLELECAIKAGPGWTLIQTKALDAIKNEIKSNRNSLDKDVVILEELKKDIGSNEEIISNKERLCEQVRSEVKLIENEVDVLRKTFEQVESHITKVDRDIEMLELALCQDKDDLRNLKTRIKEGISKRKTSDDELVINRINLEKCSRKFQENSKMREKVIIELKKQKEKNQQIDVKNTQIVCEIGERKDHIQMISHESNILVQKKDLISAKITEIEGRRLQLEEERDLLKVQINKLGHGELSTKKREYETQKRHKDSLSRELKLLERKKGLSEESSRIALDLIKASEVTGRSLQQDLRVHQTRESELEMEIKLLIDEIERKDGECKSASKRAHNSLERLNEQESFIRYVEKELDDSESMMRQKQYLCEALKTECNALSKILVKNHEEIETARREMNVVDRQINQFKMDISNIEAELVAEHFDHRNAIADKNNLQTEIVALCLHFEEINNALERKKTESSNLHKSIEKVDEDCYKNVKEYGAIIGYKDSIGNVLLRKNEELERILEKIKTQQTLLHHCDIEYQEQMTQIAKMVKKLKQLEIKKTQVDNEAIIFDDCLQQRNFIETQVQHERNQHLALKEEIGRPMNIHRWRILQDRNPSKFKKIQKIQRQQKYLIEVSTAITEKESCIRDTELECLQTKRLAERQPKFNEVFLQINSYQTVVNEKTKEKKRIEIDLALIKQEVESLRKELNKLDTEREYMKGKWIDSFYNDNIQLPLRSE